MGLFLSEKRNLWFRMRSELDLVIFRQLAVFSAGIVAKRCRAQPPGLRDRLVITTFPTIRRTQMTTLAQEKTVAAATGRGTRRCLEGLQADGLSPRHVLRRVRHYYDAICTLLLNLFANNHTDVLSADSFDPAPRRCRAAMEYMREHVCSKVAVTDIAECVGLSVRALQLSFHRYYTMTPSEALRNLRLDAVKATLEQSDPSTNVTSVLLDFGISSFGHFAAQFRNRFGVTPSEVLRTGRRG